MADRIFIRNSLYYACTLIFFVNAAVAQWCGDILPTIYVPAHINNSGKKEHAQTVKFSIPI